MPDLTHRLCGARTRSGGFCRLPAQPRGARCRIHGAKAGRPKGTPEHPNSRAARLEGRRRWAERMRLLKAAGQIERFPGGRPSRGLPPLSKDPTIRKAQRLIEKAMAEQSKAAAVQANGNEAPVAWSDLSKAEKLSRATDVGLDRVYQTLTAPYDPTDLKQAQLVTNLALSVIGQQIRLDALKELQRGDVPAAKADEERRLLDLAFDDLGVGRRLAIEAPVDDDRRERALIGEASSTESNSVADGDGVTLARS